jgi:NAD-dependent DNA ligase
VGSSSELDRDNQPVVRAFNAARLSDRAVDELIGLCRGVLADGTITDGEAKFLLQFLEANRDTALRWPCNDLFRRLREMLVDKTLDADEQAELLDLLLDITGGGLPIDERIASMSSSLPLCSPPPDVVFADRAFCLTGKFVFGSRKQCETALTNHGGSTQSSPTKTTAFLIIGSIGSREWIHSTYGRKIEKAVALRAEGNPIRIVSESHWVRFL